MRPFPGELRRSPTGYHPYILDAEQEAWLREIFPVTENRLVEKAMRTTHPTLYKLVKALGIVKSKEGLASIKKRQGETHHHINRHFRLLHMGGQANDRCTNIRIRAFTKKQVHCRHRAATLYGYVVFNGYDLRDHDTDRYTIYYDENTKRSARFEATCQRYGLKIEEYKEL